MEDVPFAKITFDNARIICIKTDEKTHVKIACNKMDGSYFEEKKNNEQPE